MAFDSGERSESMPLTRQKEAELRLQESRSPAHDQIHPVRRAKASVASQWCRQSPTAAVEATACDQGAKKPFRRRTPPISISSSMISQENNDLLLSSKLSRPSQLATSTNVHCSAISRPTRDGKSYSNNSDSSRHRFGATRSKRCPKSVVLLSLCSRRQSLLLSLLSFTFAIVTLVNLASLPHHQILVAASGSAAGAASSQHQQQQSNSVIQMQPNAAATAPVAVPMVSSGGKGRYKTMYACEDRQLTMDCDFGSKINLIRANFGRFSITQCNEQGQLDLSTDCMSPITFRIMQDRCQDKQKCSVNATSVIFGDRCPKTRKYLEVHFQCQPDPRALATSGGQFDAPERVDLRNSSQLAAAAAGGISLQQATQSVVPTHSSAAATTSYLQQTASSSQQAFIPQQNPAASGSSSILPPNNPSLVRQQQPQVFQPHHYHHHHHASPSTTSYQHQQSQQQDDFNNRQPQMRQQQPMTVMNSEIMSYNHATNSDIALSKLQDPNNNREPIIVTMRHTHIDNMSNPRCVLWDQAANQWTERGSQIIETNLTHTICAFDQATSYLLVMDHMAPAFSSSSHLVPSEGTTQTQSSPSTISNFNQINSMQQQKQQAPIVTQTSVPQFGSPIPDILDNQPVVLDQQASIRQQSAVSSSFGAGPGTGFGGNSSSNSSKFFSLFSYFLVLLFIAIAFMTIAFVASSLRGAGSSPGAAFKSLGNFAALSGGKGASSKYKHRRQDIMTGTGPGSNLHSSNKDLLVINNSNGHQFLYAPASTTKISSSSSTHILSAAIGGGHQQQQQAQGNGQQAPTHHQGTLHRVQQQMYSGNGATLSSLSAAGTQSNNYYYGLMGLSPLFQQQQQQQQHRLQMISQQQQAQSYNHQANKSTLSTKSANSSSSSGVESGSTSMQQQQQQTGSGCLVTANAANEFSMINGQLSSNCGQQAQNLFIAQNGNNNFQQQHQPATLTMNAHYSTSGVVQSPISGMTLQHQQQQAPMQHQRQMSNQLRDHIYETVEFEKPYMSRLLLPLNGANEQQQQQFGTVGHQQLYHQHHQQQQPDHFQMQQQRTMTLSSRMLHDALQQGNAVQQQNNKRPASQATHFSQPAIVRDHQAAKTNIICSKLAQVTPQRATEIGSKGAHHDMMAIYNGNDASTSTTTTSVAGTNHSCYDQQQRLELNNGTNSGNKLSTDC